MNVSNVTHAITVEIRCSSDHVADNVRVALVAWLEKQHDGQIVSWITPIDKTITR